MRQTGEHAAGKQAGEQVAGRHKAGKQAGKHAVFRQAEAVVVGEQGGGFWPLTDGRLSEVRWNRKWSLLAVLTLVLMAPAMQAAAQELVVVHEVPIVELDPLAGYINAPSPYEAGLLLYNFLVRFDSNLNIVPDLATEWSVSEDGRTWTFRLREGVVFHDGTPFNAHAVKFNLERSMDREKNPLNRPLWDPLASVEVVDEYTVRVTTHNPFPTLLNTLAHGSAGIVSPAAVERYGAAFETNPVGTGPYKLESFRPGAEVVLVRNEAYFGPRPALDRIVFRYVPDADARVAMLRSGQADIATALSPQVALALRNTPNINVLSWPTLRTLGIGFNFLTPALQDARVREAFNYAVDKQGLVRAIFMGEATVMDSPVAQNATGHATVFDYSYNPGRAAQLLEEAGWRLGPDGVRYKDGVPLSLTLIMAEGSYPNDLQVAQVVANQLRAVGAEVQIWPVERASYWDYLKAPPSQVEFDMFIWAFNPSNGDGAYALSSLFKSNPDPNDVPLVWNIGWYSNPRVDELLTQADRTVDPERRNALLREVQEILAAENPYIWLYVEHRINAARADVQGIKTLPVVFIDLSEARR